MKKVLIKQFTKSGHEKYLELLEKLIEASKSKGPEHRQTKSLLNQIHEHSKNPTQIESIGNTNQITCSDFEDRLEFGKYLTSQLKKLNKKNIYENKNFWDWMAAFYIKQIFSGRGLEVCRFAFSKDFRYGKKHLVRTPWLLYDRSGDDVAFCLSTPLHVHGNMCEQFISRMDLWKNKSVTKLCNELYYDKEAKREKKDSADHRKKKENGQVYFTEGALYPRLYKEILTLSKNKDLWSLTSDELIKLIRDEFSIWKTSKARISDKEKGNRPPPWTRNETSIALKEYFECPDKEEILTGVCSLHHKISEILRNRSVMEHKKDLKSNKTFRNANGVFRKFRNFAACDPQIEDGKFQDENYSKLDKELVSKFSGSNLKELKLIVDMLLQKN
jgi:hypothetical protein